MSSPDDITKSVLGSQPDIIRMLYASKYSWWVHISAEKADISKYSKISCGKKKLFQALIGLRKIYNYASLQSSFEETRASIAKIISSTFVWKVSQTFTATIT